MANSLTALNPEVWKSMVQAYLNKMLVAKEISTVRSEVNQYGDQINFPEVTDVRVQSYTQGTDLTIDPITATQSSLIVDQSKAVTFPLDPVQKKQALADYGATLVRQSAYQLRNNMDQHCLATGVSAASSTVAGSSLGVSDIISKVSDVHAQLMRNNAADGALFGVVDPERASLMSQAIIANGFNLADAQLMNGKFGSALGFDWYVSNNLKYSVTMTNDTQPTAGDTLTIAGVTWTCVADGTAASAGEVNIGADLADWKTIIVKAINGTTSTDYVDVSTANRRKLQNAQVTAAAFSSDDCTITGYGKLSASETFTAATNVFGTETTNMLFGQKGAISLAMQIEPELYIQPESAQPVDNYITISVWGDKVFSRDVDRLVKLSCNA